METLEIVKIVLPVIASSGIVAYFFNRKIKRLEAYKDIINQIFKRIIEGIEEIQPLEKK